MTVVEQAWDDQTPIDTVHMVNLIATIPGARKDRLVIAGHYDTKLFREFRFVGASDGGSSAAFLIELARVLKARRNALTIELLFLDGEEARLPEWQRHRQHLRQPPLRRRRAKRDGSLADAEGDGPRRHDRRPRSAHQARHQFDAVADRPHLGRGQRQKLDDYFVARLDARSKTITCRSSPPACRRSTSSTSTTSRGTPPKDTLDAVSARSLQVVGDVVLAALPQIEARFTRAVTLTGRRLRPRRPYVLTAVHHKMKKGHKRRALNAETAVAAH